MARSYPTPTSQKGHLRFRKRKPTVLPVASAPRLMCQYLTMLGTNAISNTGERNWRLTLIFSPVLLQISLRGPVQGLGEYLKYPRYQLRSEYSPRKYQFPVVLQR